MNRQIISLHQKANNMKILTVVFLFISSSSFAGLSPYFTLEGKVESFNDKNVIIKVGKKRFQLSRDNVTSIKSAGKECTAVVEKNEITLVK